MTDLKVLPNPWLSLDVAGHPCAVVPIDFFKHGTGRRWVGAKLKVTETRKQQEEKIGKLSQVVVEAEHAQHWDFAIEPVTIPFSDYYVERIKHGELISADAQTAAHAGRNFVEPANVLAASRAKAISEYDGQHGEGAWAANNPVVVATSTPTQPTTTATPEATPESTASKKTRKE